MQKTMQVTPMWMPMTMPVVDVWLVTSSFRQSHGGLKARGQGRLGHSLPGLKQDSPAFFLCLTPLTFPSGPQLNLSALSLSF